MTILVHRPTGRAVTTAYEPAARPDRLAARRLHLLSNGKTPSVQLLEALSRRLEAEDGVVPAGLHRKRVSGAGAGTTALDRIAADADLVVNALAD